MGREMVLEWVDRMPMMWPYAHDDKYRTLWSTPLLFFFFVLSRGNHHLVYARNHRQEKNVDCDISGLGIIGNFKFSVFFFYVDIY